MRESIRAAALAGLGLLSGLSGTGCASPTATLAIRDVTVIPMTGEGVQEHRTVVVTGDRIGTIGAADDVRVPEGVEVIDGSGRYLIPGLVDAHVHLMDRNDLPLLLSRGVTSVLNMAGAPMQLAWREDIEAGRLVGPRLYTTGPQLKVEANPAIDFERAAVSPDEVRELVAYEARAGYDFVKIWGPLDAAVYEAALAAARSANIRTTGHIPRTVGLDGVLDAGQSSVAHVEEYLNKVLARRRDRAQLAEVAELSARRGLTVITTLVAYEAIAASVAADIEPLLSRPERRLLDPVRALLWEPGFNRYRTPAREGRAPEYRDKLAYQQEIARALHQAGVRLVAGSDAGEIPGLVPGVDLHRELELLVEAGLSPLDALATATVNAGRFLTPQEPLAGTVAEGAPADLVLLAADPLEEIGNTRSIVATVARGTPLDPEALERAVLAENENTRPLLEEVLGSDVAGATAYALRQAEAGHPPAMTPMLFLAYALFEKGNPTGAIEVLELTARLYPDSYMPSYMLGMAALGAGDETTGRAALERVLALVPDHDGALRALGRELPERETP
jgi:imidazolonepropionase-like amidohydrolase